MSPISELLADWGWNQTVRSLQIERGMKLFPHSRIHAVPGCAHRRRENSLLKHRMQRASIIHGEGRALHLWKYKRRLSLALALCLFAFSILGHAQNLSPKLQNAVGHWQVINNDGSKGGQVQTYIENGVLFGKVTGARPGRAPDSVCDRCPGALKGQRIMGMIVIRNFTRKAMTGSAELLWIPRTARNTRERCGPLETTSWACAGLSASR